MVLDSPNIKKNVSNAPKIVPTATRPPVYHAKRDFTWKEPQKPVNLVLLRIVPYVRQRIYVLNAKKVTFSTKKRNHVKKTAKIVFNSTVRTAVSYVPLVFIPSMRK